MPCQLLRVGGCRIREHALVGSIPTRVQTKLLFTMIVDDMSSTGENRAVNFTQHSAWMPRTLMLRTAVCLVCACSLTSCTDSPSPWQPRPSLPPLPSLPPPPFHRRHRCRRRWRASLQMPPRLPSMYARARVLFACAMHTHARMRLVLRFMPLMCVCNVGLLGHDSPACAFRQRESVRESRGCSGAAVAPHDVVMSVAICPSVSSDVLLSITRRLHA